MINSVGSDQTDPRGVWPRGYKTFSMLNSAEHELLNAHN